MGNAVGRLSPGFHDQLEEARLNVELLNVEYQAYKGQLTQQLQMLPQAEHGSWGMGGGMGMGGFDGRPMSEEEARKQRDEYVKSMREGVDGLRAATLGVGRRLGRERRRVAELEVRLGESPSASSDPDMEQRLAKIERKLDQVLKELAALKEQR